MKKYLTVGITTLAVIGAIACSSGGPSDDDTKRLDNHANSGTSAPPVAKKHITAGDWEIGKKENIDAGVITAGTYTITVPEDGFSCYYKVVKDFDDTLDSIIVNGNIEPGATKRLVIKSSYAGLSLEHDCLATKKK